VARLADPGDVTAMMAEKSAARAVGDRVADRLRSDRGFGCRGDLGKGAHQPQRLGQKIAQMDLEMPLPTDLRERCGGGTRRPVH